MTAPPRGVLARAKAPGDGPVQHVLDPPPQALGGLGLGRPDRLQHLQHVRGIGRVYRKIAYDGERVGRKCLPPLFAMLGIAPARSVRLDERFGAFGESHAAPLRCQRRPALAERVLAGCQQRALRRGPLPCLGQRDRAGWAQAKLAASALSLVAKYPALRATLAHLQVKASPVTVVARLSVLRLTRTAESLLIARGMYPCSYPCSTSQCTRTWTNEQTRLVCNILGIFTILGHWWTDPDTHVRGY